MFLKIVTFTVQKVHLCAIQFRLVVHENQHSKVIRRMFFKIVVHRPKKVENQWSRCTWTQAHGISKCNSPGNSFAVALYAKYKQWSLSAKLVYVAAMNGRLLVIYFYKVREYVFPLGPVRGVWTTRWHLHVCTDNETNVMLKLLVVENEISSNLKRLRSTAVRPGLWSRNLNVGVPAPAPGI